MIETSPLDPSDIRRALFIRLRRFGDTILMGPSLRAFKAWAPESRLAVVVEPGYEAFLELMPEVDDIIIAERGPVASLRTVQAIRRFHPDLTVDFYGAARAAWMAWTSRARTIVGESRFRWPVYHIRAPRAEYLFGLRRRAHTVENHLALLAAVGIPTPRLPLQLPVDHEARSAIAERRSKQAIPGGPLAVLFPTTTLRGKQWPIERWLSLARRLAEAWDGAVVMQFAAQEAHIAQRARAAVGGAHVLGEVSLRELNALVADADLVLTHDSLGAHLAAAHGVPTVALFGGTDPARYEPWGDGHVVLSLEGLSCSPCGGRSCRSPYYPWACIDGIDEDVVLETALDLLRRESRGGERPLKVLS